MDYKRHDIASMNKQRRILAVMGLLLPLLSTLPGFIAYEQNGPEFWWSISATFYASSNIFMIGCLSIFAFFLWTYKGYDIGDSFTCKFSALMCAGILVFPCECWASGATTGVFNLNTETSHIIHCVIAGLLFASFAYMIGFRFTKHGTDKNMTYEKFIRNLWYRMLSVFIMVIMCFQLLTSFVLDVGWMTIVNEALMLWAFSAAWGIKAGLFLKDKK